MQNVTPSNEMLIALMAACMRICTALCATVFAAEESTVDAESAPKANIIEPSNAQNAAELQASLALSFQVWHMLDAESQISNAMQAFFYFDS